MGFLREFFPPMLREWVEAITVAAITLISIGAFRTFLAPFETQRVALSLGAHLLLHQSRLRHRAESVPRRRPPSCQNHSLVGQRRLCRDGFHPAFTSSSRRFHRHRVRLEPQRSSHDTDFTARVSPAHPQPHHALCVHKWRHHGAQAL